MDSHSSTALAAIPRQEGSTLERVSPVVAVGLEILREHPSPDTLRELLAVQKEWEANEARKAYAAALVGLKRDLPTVIKRDATVDFTSAKGRTFYKHASLAGVMDAITDPLTQHGFSLAWKPNTGQNGVSVTCRLTHAAGHFEEATLSAPPDTSGSKSAPQAIASTITLLQRYSALALLGIATADMKEPEAERESDPESIDINRNMRAVVRLKELGRTKDQAEAYLMRSVSEWTASDIERLKEWTSPAPRGATQEGA